MSTPISGFKELRVWQAGIDLVQHVYVLTEAFPRREVYGLTSQMRRAALSVPANIAEGHTREHTKEYLNYVSMAQASLAELETHLEVAARLGYLSPERLGEALEKVTSLGRQLYALRNALIKKGDRGRGSGDRGQGAARSWPLTPGPWPLTPDPLAPGEARR